jgi:hypothetical protein
MNATKTGTSTEIAKFSAESKATGNPFTSATSLTAARAPRNAMTPVRPQRCRRRNSQAIAAAGVIPSAQ